MMINFLVSWKGWINWIFKPIFKQYLHIDLCWVIFRYLKYFAIFFKCLIFIIISASYYRWIIQTYLWMTLERAFMFMININLQCLSVKSNYSLILGTEMILSDSFVVRYKWNQIIFWVNAFSGEYYFATTFLKHLESE